VAIQQAITDAAANGIPEVIISKPGTYIVDLHVIPGQTFYAAAIWGASNVKLTMKPGVVIKLMNSATLPVGATAGQIIGNSAAALRTNWAIEGGVVDGNGDNQSATTVLTGVVLNRCRSSYVKGVVVRNVYGTASAPPGETLHFEATNCRDVQFIDCEADGSGTSNTATGFSTNNSFGVSWTNCISHDMGFGMGFTCWQAAGLRYTNCHAYLNGYAGFNAEISEGVVYSSCISGSRSPLVGNGNSQNPYFPGGQTELGNTVGFAIHGCTDVVGVGCVSTYNETNLHIYTQAASVDPAKVCTRVMFTGCDLRNASASEVVVETAATGGQDQIDVEIINCLSGTLADSIYNFSKAPLINYFTGSSGIRLVHNGATGAYSWRWFTDKVSGPIGSGGVMGINPDGQLHTSGRKVQRRAVAASTTITLQDEVIAVTDTSAARTITLPSAATAGAGATYVVKDESGGAGTNNITIQRVGSDLIEGATTKSISINYGYARLISTGSAWVMTDEDNGTIASAAMTLTNKTLASPAVTGITSVAQNGTIALYNTVDQTTNYERVRQFWSSNVYNIASENGGTGTNRTILLSSNNKTLTVGNSGLAWFDFTSNTTGVATPTVRIGGTAQQSSGAATPLSVVTTINQSGTASYTALLINPTETATGSGAKKLIDAQVGGSSKFAVDNTGKVTLSGTSATVSSGTGSPESVVIAPIGSIYTRTDGGAGTTLYIKESGAGNTGWVAK
jgi:hypothetical protein